MQPLRRQLRRRFNIDIIRAGNTAILGEHIKDILETHRVDTVLDVGANTGQFGSYLRELGFAGAIHSFEPVEKTFRVLQRTAASDARWSCHKMALGREPGTLTMNLMGASDLNSALQPSTFGKNLFAEFQVTGQEQVPMSTVDIFLAEHVPAPERGILLKMDTQGFDLEVFAGAEQSLGRIRCLLSELSLTPLYDGMPGYLKSLATFEERGFLMSGLYPVNRNKDLSFIEVDCMLVNRHPA